MRAVILIRDMDAARLLERQIQALEEHGESVVIPDPGEALWYLDGHAVDVVFLDIDDESDWPSVCRMVKYTDEKINLVLLSGNPRNAVKAFEAGASDFVSKPVVCQRLAKAIGRCVQTGKRNDVIC